MKETLAMIFFAALLAALGVAGAFDSQEAERASTEYAEMVCLNRSNPDIGWPNYKNLTITCEG